MKSSVVIPALIDPHVHFRTPGHEHKENWISGAQAAIKSGVTTVIDMPNNNPSCTTFDRLIDKHALIKEQIKASGIPLRYFFYFGADRLQLKEISKAKEHAIGIKIFMGSSTGELLVDDPETLEEIFKIAADLDMLISVHAEDEEIIRLKKAEIGFCEDPSIHSQIRCRTAALKAVKLAIELSAKYHVRLCILHVSTADELELIGKAKKSGVPVFAEVSPHHLFLTTGDYAKWGTRVQVNPPLREMDDQQALWRGIHDGTVEFIGTDHAPHTLAEKNQPYGRAPSGIPSIELLLPLMLHAVNEGRLDLATLIKLTSTNITSIFRLPPNDDVVLIDLEHEREVRDEDLKTKCGWSPYKGRLLKGWPTCTIAQGKVFQL